MTASCLHQLPSALSTFSPRRIALATTATASTLCSVCLSAEHASLSSLLSPLPPFLALPCSTGPASL